MNIKSIVKDYADLATEKRALEETLLDLQASHNELYYTLMAIVNKLPDKTLELHPNDYVTLSEYWRMTRQKYDNGTVIYRMAQLGD